MTAIAQTGNDEEDDPGIAICPYDVPEAVKAVLIPAVAAAPPMMLGIRVAAKVGAAV